MKPTKAQLRRAWVKEAGLRDYSSNAERSEPIIVKYPNCAVVSVDRRATWAVLGGELRYLLIDINDKGLAASLGVTPEERRDCMIAMLLAGAFDPWLDEE